MKVISGKIAKAQKVVIYGPEGIGKSTLASQFPKAIFIDVEESTNNMQVDRLEKPTSWQTLNNQIDWVKTQIGTYQTVIIDTADWAEVLCKEKVMADNKWTAIDSLNYGTKYVALATEWGKLLNKLSEVANNGINVVLTAHAAMKKFELPEEMGAYDRWELKLEKRSAAITKEWADLILFCNYKTIVIQVDKKSKAQGQERVMHTTHNAVWDAKNRHGLAPTLEMKFESIAHIFEVNTISQTQEQKIIDNFADIVKEVENTPIEQQVNPFKPENVPTGLWDLMLAEGITVQDIQKATAHQGIAPLDTPIENYPIEYLNHIQSQWEAFKEIIKNIK